jgi:hypothetical protein
MAEKVDISFGEIVLKTGLASNEQIEESLKFQGTLPTWKPLGQIMVEKGYITLEQLNVITQIQKRNIEAKAIQLRRIKEDNIFGQLVVKLGFSSQEKVDECLGVQLAMKDDYFLRLGEIMIKKGHITTEQVQVILNYQSKQLVICAKCGTRYNMLLFNPEVSFVCYGCGNELTTPSLPSVSSH